MYIYHLTIEFFITLGFLINLIIFNKFNILLDLSLKIFHYFSKIIYLTPVIP